MQWTREPAFQIMFISRFSAWRVGSALPAKATGKNGGVRGSIQAILFFHQGCLSGKWVLTGWEFHGHSYIDRVRAC